MATITQGALAEPCSVENNKIGISVCDRVENIVGKGENSGY